MLIDGAYTNTQIQQKLLSHKSVNLLVSLVKKNDLYASVMIAQAILESGAGQSSLSSYPHYNLFGIKGSYAGQSTVMQTWEDDGWKVPIPSTMLSVHILATMNHYKTM